jgi:hypothetical protein
MAADPWAETKLKVARAYNALVDVGRADPAQLGPVGTFRVVPLPDGLECRVTVARAPTPGEIRLAPVGGEIRAT